MKKIALGVNLFGASKRSDLCIESILKCKEKFPSMDLYNVQFQDTSIKHRKHEAFKPLHVLRKSNQDVITAPSKKIIPLMDELFDALALLNYDYFCFTNDDIILSNRYFDFINTTNYDCYPASRQAIQPIETLVNANIVGEHYQVAGFDTFCIKTTWWNEFRDKFPGYILGHPCWDVHYATLCMRFGNSTLCNKWPPPTFHIIHGDDSHNDSPEKTHNFGLYWKPHKFDVDMWHNYLFSVLLRRPGANYMTPHDNELELEKQFFSDDWFKNNYRSYQ